jgi:hypothetical protein
MEAANLSARGWAPGDPAWGRQPPGPAAAGRFVVEVVIQVVAGGAEAQRRASCLGVFCFHRNPVVRRGRAWV